MSGEHALSSGAILRWSIVQVGARGTIQGEVLGTDPISAADVKEAQVFIKTLVPEDASVAFEHTGNGPMGAGMAFRHLTGGNGSERNN